jgi:plasmid stabilization system protein ParE
MSGVSLHPEALLDLDEIWEFVAQENIEAADRLISEIFGAFDALALFPHQGHHRPDLTGRPLRFKVVREYLVAYAPEERPLWIVAVIHGRRSPRVIAAVLRGREPAS